ncbi:MAG TPA: hypothetical protein VH277_08205 [Gemmatimonadaceae bacterium]|nr:hypothetical protein [Gemmatimonadaceae bacterium]
MPIREFVDPEGVHWRVWNTFPFSMAGVADEMREGWLTFEPMTVVRRRRRLAPIPHDWQQAPDTRLCEYCTSAAPVGRTPTDGTPNVTVNA